LVPFGDVDSGRSNASALIFYLTNLEDLMRAPGCSLLLFILMFLASFQGTAQWVKTASAPKGSGITDMVVKQSNGYLFATTGSFDWPNADTGGVHRSTDGGNTWERVFPAYVARVIEVTPDGNIWASVWDFPNQDESMYSSSDDGETWTLRYDGAPSNNIFSFAYDPGNPQIMWLGIRSAIVVSYDGGVNWSHLTPVNLGWWIIQVVVQQSTGAFTGRVWVIAQQPTTLVNHVYWTNAPSQGWNQISGDSPTDTLVSLAVVHDSTDAFGAEVDGVYAGTLGGKVYKVGPVYRAPFPPPSSMSVVYEDPGLANVRAFTNVDYSTATSGPERDGPVLELFAIMEGGPFGPSAFGSSGGVVRSDNRGQSWEMVNEGLPPGHLRMSSAAAHITSGVTATVYAGMFLDQNDGGPVYSMEVVATDVGPNESAVPEGFALDQNYPNPFNPQTEIGYRIPETGLVRLSIHDLLGREVATLVDEKKSPGFHQVTWDASGQASGIYFYRLRAGSYVETKKLVLMR
jgi:hypothetical protein